MNASVRETLCELLEMHGHHAIGARDGVEALAVLRSGDRVSFMVPVEAAPLGVPVLPKPIDMQRLLQLIDACRAN